MPTTQITAETPLTPDLPFEEMTVAELLALARGHGVTGFKVQKATIIAALRAEFGARAAWEKVKANPTVHVQGHRIILDDGTEIPLTLAPHFQEHGTYRKEWVRVTYEPPGWGSTEQATGAEVEGALDTARRNIGANYKVREYLRPGQRTREELEARIRELEAAANANTLRNPWEQG